MHRNFFNGNDAKNNYATCKRVRISEFHYTRAVQMCIYIHIFFVSIFFFSSHESALYITLSSSPISRSLSSSRFHDLFHSLDKRTPLLQSITYCEEVMGIVHLPPTTPSLLHVVMTFTFLCHDLSLGRAMVIHLAVDVAQWRTARKTHTESIVERISTRRRVTSLWNIQTSRHTRGMSQLVFRKIPTLLRGTYTFVPRAWWTNSKWHKASLDENYQVGLTHRVALSDISWKFKELRKNLKTRRENDKTNENIIK